MVPINQNEIGVVITVWKYSQLCFNILFAVTWSTGSLANIFVK